MKYLMMVMALLLAGCPAIPKSAKPNETQTARDLTTATKGPRSGGSSAETSTTDMPFAPAVAWGASTADSTSTTAKYSPTQTSASTGSLVTGFVQGITAMQRSQIGKIVGARIKSDPVLKSIADELVYLMTLEDLDEGRVDALRIMYRAAQSDIMAELADSGETGGLSLSSLKTLIVVGFISGSNAGTEERAPSDVEVENLARLLPNIVNAAKGNEQIVKSDEEVTGEPE